MLNPGDVVLLEATVAGGLPCETQDHVATAIQVATSSSQGIVVIEAAGNSATNLDDWANSITKKQNVNPASPDYIPSGAILVGASKSTVTQQGWRYGASEMAPLQLREPRRLLRLGRRAFLRRPPTQTAKPSNESLQRRLRQHFGSNRNYCRVALSVQGMAEVGRHGKRFVPAQLRLLLRDRPMERLV